MGSTEYSEADVIDKQDENPKIFTFHCHYRKIDEGLRDINNPKGISSKGGCTVAAIQHGKDKIRWGIARCNEIDVFNRRMGKVRSYGIARSRSAAETPMMHLDSVHVVAREFARVAMGTFKNIMTQEIQRPEFDKKIAQDYQVYNYYFERIDGQQLLL